MCMYVYISLYICIYIYTYVVGRALVERGVEAAHDVRALDAGGLV